MSQQRRKTSNRSLGKGEFEAFEFWKICFPCRSFVNLTGTGVSDCFTLVGVTFKRFSVAAAGMMTCDEMVWVSSHDVRVDA